jgi:hypothetical protein
VCHLVRSLCGGRCAIARAVTGRQRGRSTGRAAATLGRVLPLDATTALRAAVALRAARPRRLVELGLVDLPYAARAPQASQRDGAADWQQIVRPNLGHAAPRTRLARVALTGAAKSGTEAGEACLPNWSAAVLKASACTDSKRCACGRAAVHACCGVIGPNSRIMWPQVALHALVSTPRSSRRRTIYRQTGNADFVRADVRPARECGLSCRICKLPAWCVVQN